MADEDLIPVVIPPGLPPGTTMAVIHNGSQVAEAVQATAVPAGGSVTAVEAVPYQPGVQAVRINGFGAQQDLSVGPVASQSDLAYAEEILRARAWVSCFAMIDVFLIFVSILSRLGYWGLLLIFGPLYGYYGARSLNATKVAVYVVFKIFHVLIYLIAAFEAKTSGQFFWGILLTLCEVYITWEVNKFYKMLRSLDEGRLMRAMEQIHASHYGPRGI